MRMREDEDEDFSTLWSDDPGFEACLVRASQLNCDSVCGLFQVRVSSTYGKSTSSRFRGSARLDWMSKLEVLGSIQGAPMRLSTLSLVRGFESRQGDQAFSRCTFWVESFLEAGPVSWWLKVTGSNPSALWRASSSWVPDVRAKLLLIVTSSKFR